MAKKANGKARKKSNRKAEQESTWYDVGLVPFDGKLTSARAKRWLDKEHEAFFELATAGLGYAKDKGDREAFKWFTSSVKRMTDACADAMSGGSVVVTSDIGGGPCGDGTYCFGWMQNALRILRLPSLARDSIHQVAWGDSEFDAFDALVRFVERYVEAASALEDQATEDTVRRRRAEEAEGEPNARLDVIRERRKAIEAECDAAFQKVAGEAFESVDSASEALTAAVERVIKKAEEPWNRQLAHLKYEENLIWHELGDPNVKHPGKPPEGYEPVTLGEQG